MSKEKPLNVRVAEALGWTQPGSAERVWWAYDPEPAHSWQVVPCYDTNWSATGPLIEKYGIWLKYSPWMYPSLGDDRVWDAFKDMYMAAGSTPLEAVCELILLLHKVGELKEIK